MDVPWKYLNFFLDDDERLADIGQRYAKGDETMLTGHVKKELITVRLNPNPPPPPPPPPPPLAPQAAIVTSLHAAACLDLCTVHDSSQLLVRQLMLQPSLPVHSC